MEPLGFLLGVAAFNLAVKYKKPLRKAAVFAASQALTVAEGLKSIAYGVKEEIEDIVAEAQYENMKSSANGHGKEDEAQDAGNDTN